MAHKHIDFAYFGPKSYTDAADQPGPAVALEMNKESRAGYYGIIIVKKGSGIKSMEQTKGKTFAFTDPNSTSGFLVPNILFYLDLKTKPEEYFNKISFSGSHGASILAVKNGTVEVAATNNIDLDRMVEKGQASLDDFDVLWRSELIPGSPMAARKDLPESLKAAFAGALIMFNGQQGRCREAPERRLHLRRRHHLRVIRYLNRSRPRWARSRRSPSPARRGRSCSRDRPRAFSPPPCRRKTMEPAPTLAA